MKRLRIRIVGGSLAGLFAGILLQRDGHDVKIYERSPSGLAGRGAGLVGQHDLFRILRAIGCEHVARVGVVAKERIYFNRDGSIAETSRTPQMQISWDFLYSPVASHMVAESYQIGKPVVDVVEGAEFGVTSNAICPGYVWTPLVEHQIEDQAKSHKIARDAVIRDVFLKDQPTKRFATIEEMGALAVFLCGDLAGSITGTAIPVDGGWTAH